MNKNKRHVKQNARQRKRNANKNKNNAKVNAVIADLKRRGFDVSKTGNVQIPDGFNRKFNDKLVKNPDVLGGVLNQRRGQRSKTGKMLDSLPDKLIEMEENGLDPAIICDIFDCDENAAEMNVIEFAATPYKPAIKRMCAAPVLSAINHNITQVQDIVTVPILGDFSKGELTLIRLYYEAFLYMSGETPRMQVQHPIMNRWLSLLSPRQCRDRVRGLTFGLSWEIIPEFDFFFNQSDFYPEVSTGVTVGKVTSYGDVSAARFQFPGVVWTADLIEEFCTNACIEILTLLSNKSVNKNMVDPLDWILEKDLPHAWSVPTGFTSEENTDLRYWAAVRSCIPLKKSTLLPYACIGIVDPSTISVNEELFPVRTTCFVTPAHMYLQFAHADTFDPMRSHGLMYYQKGIYFEQIVRRVFFILFEADSKLNATLDYNSGGLKQNDDSIFHFMANKDLFYYVAAAISTMFYDSWVGATSTPKGDVAFAGTAFMPNPVFKLAPLPLAVIENLEMCGSSWVDMDDGFGHRIKRFTVPVLRFNGNCNSTNHTGTSIDTAVQEFFGNGVSISYDWSSTSEFANPNLFFNVGVPSSLNADSYDCLTTGIAVGNLSKRLPVFFNRLQPSVGLSLVTGTHSNTYTYDGMTRCVTYPTLSADSGYNNMENQAMVAKHFFKWYISASLIEIIPVFVIGSMLDDLTQKFDTIAMTSAIYSQTHLIPYFFESNLKESLALITIDSAYAQMVVGSRYEEAITSLMLITRHRLVDGQGGFLALIKGTIEGVSIVTTIGAEIADYFEKNDIANVLRKVSKYSSKISGAFGSRALSPYDAARGHLMSSHFNRSNDRSFKRISHVPSRSEEEMLKELDRLKAQLEAST